jgi:Zn-finger protein
LQSNDAFNKVKAEVHQDSGKLGVEFTVDKTIPDFNKGAGKINLDWIHSFEEFENVLQGQYKTAWKQIVHEFFPEPVDPSIVIAEQDRSREENFRRAITLFLRKALHEDKPRDRQWIYMAPGGDYNVQKALVTKPIDHLHRWEEMFRVAELLPAGDIETPSASLQVEWFYMTFHKTDRAEYVRSGRKLRDETLQTLAEYFESIYDTRQNDGHYRRMQVEKVRSDAKREMRHELEQRYARKLKRFASERRTEKPYAMRGRGGNDHNRRSEYGRREIDNRDRRYNDKRNDKRSDDKKSPPEREKGFKPCHMHGERSNHSFAECRLNPLNQAGSNPRANNNGKRAHDAHYQHDKRYASSDDESRGNLSTPMPSDGEISDSGGGKIVDDNYHLSLGGRCPKKTRVTKVLIRSHKNNPAKPSEKDISDWDEAFEDAYPSPIGMVGDDEDLFENGTNPFAFGN